MTVLNVEIEDNVLQQLNQYANLQGKNTLDIVQEAIICHLENLLDIRSATQALQRLETGETTTLLLEELEERLNALDN